jgi:quinol monooxygenase YgiN
MNVTLGILALLEAKPGKGEELAAFLTAGRELAIAEDGTVTWYAFRLSATQYGIFDSFATGEARTAHLNGEIPKALATIADDLLAGEPSIQLVDLLAVK